MRRGSVALSHTAVNNARQRLAWCSPLLLVWSPVSLVTTRLSSNAGNPFPPNG
jgi:hypothetical protein